MKVGFLFLDVSTNNCSHVKKKYEDVFTLSREKLLDYQQMRHLLVRSRRKRKYLVST